MAIEPPPPANRALLRRLIRYAFEHAPQSVEQDPGVTVEALVRALKTRGTQLTGVSATEVNRVRIDQVREELISMPDVRGLDINTARERFQLQRTGNAEPTS